MPFELDHIFVCTSVGAPEARRLIELGVDEGEPNTHPGQGTANRRFFFNNAMLELLWVHDETEARSPPTRRTRLFERWRKRSEGACPFGICLRPTKPSRELPFTGWSYTPAYLPAPQVIHIGGNSERLAEPMLFHIPFGVAPETAPVSRRQPLQHGVGLREITRVHWIRPDGPRPSAELSAVLDSKLLSMASGPSHLLEIGFDHEAGGMRVSLAPELPLILSW